MTEYADPPARLFGGWSTRQLLCADSSEFPVDRNESANGSDCVQSLLGVAHVCSCTHRSCHTHGYKYTLLIAVANNNTHCSWLHPGEPISYRRLSAHPPVSSVILLRGAPGLRDSSRPGPAASRINRSLQITDPRIIESEDLKRRCAVSLSSPQIEHPSTPFGGHEQVPTHRIEHRS